MGGAGNFLGFARFARDDSPGKSGALRNLAIKFFRIFGGHMPKNIRPDSYTIYALIDPRDFTPFYVGRTKSPAVRHVTHLSPSKWVRQGGRYGEKMQELRKAGLCPYFGVLEITEDPSREGHHIAHLKQLGYDLVNAYGIIQRKASPRRTRVIAESTADRQFIDGIIARVLDDSL
jgi:hypothetical protein